MPSISNTVIYICMGLIIAVMAFLTLRFVLQMIFLRECPNCGRMVSLAGNRECANCGYIFLRERYLKLSFTIFLLCVAIVGMGYLSVRTFKAQTNAYIQANPRIAAAIAAEKAQKEKTDDTSNSYLSLFSGASSLEKLLL